MLSRPLVAGLLAGWALGDPAPRGSRSGCDPRALPAGVVPDGRVALSRGGHRHRGRGGRPRRARPARGAPARSRGGARVGPARRGVDHRSAPPERAPRAPRAESRAAECVAWLSCIVLALLPGLPHGAGRSRFSGRLAGPIVIAGLGAALAPRPTGSVGLLLVGASVSAGILLRDFGGFRGGACAWRRAWRSASSERVSCERPAPRARLASAFLRSFLIQGSWNYHTMIGCGFAFAMLPGLRALTPPPEAERWRPRSRGTSSTSTHTPTCPMWRWAPC
jgi:hypothetical protein